MQVHNYQKSNMKLTLQNAYRDNSQKRTETNAANQCGWIRENLFLQYNVATSISNCRFIYHLLFKFLIKI